MIVLSFQGKGSIDNRAIQAIAEELDVATDLIACREFDLPVYLRSPDPRSIIDQILANADVNAATLIREPLVILLPRHPLAGILIVEALAAFTGKRPLVANINVQAGQVPEVLNLVDLADFTTSAQEHRVRSER